MSIARTTITKKVRKDWTCGKCGAAIRKGIDGRLSYAVGFRGREQTRCLKPECRPTRSELESSAVAAVYDAIDSIDVSTLHNLDELQQAANDVADAMEEVASEYESNEMYEINEQLQERAEMLNSAADELRSWEPTEEEPDEEESDCQECDGSGKFDEGTEDEVDCDACEGTGKAESLHESWLEDARQELENALNDAELP